MIVTYIHHTFFYSECECNMYGSVNETCGLSTGNCECNTGYSGKKCSQCVEGYYSSYSSSDSFNKNCTGMLIQKLDLVLKCMIADNY